MSHELFTDLSVEQQEIVAGGVDATDFLNTYYDQELFVFDTTIASTGEGSVINQEFATVDVFTEAIKDFTVSF